MKVNFIVKQTVIFLLGLCFLFYYYSYSPPSFNSDEYITYFNSQGFNVSSTIENVEYNIQDLLKPDIENVIRATVLDNGNAVAYNLFLHVWTKFFGHEISSLRLMSLFFSAIVLLLFIKFTTLINNSFWFIIASIFLFATNPLVIQFSTEIRGYIAALAFSLYFVYLSYSLVKSNNVSITNLIILGVSGSLAIMSHYFSVYVLLISASHLLMHVYYSKKEKLFKTIVIPSSIVLVIVGAWLIYGGLQGFDVMLEQNQRFKNNALQNTPATILIVATSPSSIGKLGFLHFTTIFNTSYFWEFISSIKARYLWGILILLFLLFSSSVIIKPRKSINYFFFASGVSSLLMGLILSVFSGHTGSFIDKYGVFAVPFIVISTLVGLNKILKIETNKIFGVVLKVVAVLTIITHVFFITVNLASKNTPTISDTEEQLIFALDNYTANQVIIIEGKKILWRLLYHVRNNKQPIYIKINSEINNSFEVRNR